MYALYQSVGKTDGDTIQVTGITSALGCFQSNVTMTTSEGLPLLYGTTKPLSPRSAAAAEAEAAAKRQRRRRNFILTAAALALLGAIVYFVHHPPQPLNSPDASATDATPPIISPIGSDSPYARVMADFRSTNDFDGVVQVTENHHVTYADWSGRADEEFDVPMARDSIFPIGSNSKLFTAVALYQLQERGLVDLSSAVNDHLNGADFANFGFPNQTRWCPRLASDVGTDAPCENITFVQLMHMGSGIGDSLNCDNVDAAHCHRSADNLVYYKGSLGPYVGVFINDPLVFKPDTDYSYSNPNYYLLSYMVEKLSGQSFEAYLDEHIFRKIGLNNTYYDPYSGVLGVRRGYVQQYIHYYAQASAEVPMELLATGTCAPYMNSGAISGSGGMRSTVEDMQRWYLDLFGSRGAESKLLTAESIRMIVDRVNPVNPLYAQGIGIASRGEDGWPTILRYCGGMKCCVTCMAMLNDAGQTNNTAVISVFSNHMHYTFADRATFDRFRPMDVMGIPTAWTVAVDDDGGANALPTPLVRAYLAQATNATN